MIDFMIYKELYTLGVYQSQHSVCIDYLNISTPLKSTVKISLQAGQGYPLTCRPDWTNKPVIQESN